MIILELSSWKNLGKILKIGGRNSGTALAEQFADEVFVHWPLSVVLIFARELLVESKPFLNKIRYIIFLI